MSRIATIALALCLASALGVVGAAAQSPDASPPAPVATPTTGSPMPGERIALPNGWQPEGIATDGSALFVGSLADGAIWRGDPVAGTGDVFIAGQDGSVAVGIDHEAEAGRLWVAGGPTGEVRVYDAAAGDLLATWAIDGAGFLNDVAVMTDAAYVTDSSAPSLVVIPIGDDGALASTDEATTIALGGAYEHVDEAFNLNGIVAAGEQLLAVQSSSGRLYLIDPESGEATVVDLGGYEVTNGDGLEVDRATLYVVRNQANLVAVVDLADDLSTGSLRTELTSSDFDVPTTVALVGDSLWLPNARFGTDPTPDTEYWLTRLDLPVTAG